MHYMFFFTFVCCTFYELSLSLSQITYIVVQYNTSNPIAIILITPTPTLPISNLKSTNSSYSYPSEQREKKGSVFVLLKSLADTSSRVPYLSLHKIFWKSNTTLFLTDLSFLSFLPYGNFLSLQISPSSLLHVSCEHMFFFLIFVQSSWIFWTWNHFWELKTGKLRFLRDG